MRQIIAATALVVAGTAQGEAGAIERTGQSVDILFTPGTRVELSLGTVSPSVSGQIAGTPYETDGNVLERFGQWGVAFKMPVGSALDLALVVDQPIGADLAYPSGASYPITGTTATVQSTAVTLLGRYRLPDSPVSLIGGLRAQRTSGTIGLPVTLPGGMVLPYTMESTEETDFGYVLGLAYERPEIGLRLSVTYNSPVNHAFSVTETTALGTFDSTVFTTIPQSVNLAAETGISDDTMVFAHMRWVDWSAFAIDPDAYRTQNPFNPVGAALVSYRGDYTTWTAGVGHRFDPAWAGTLSAIYEGPISGPGSNLAPTNGYSGLQATLIHTHGRFEVTGMLRYIRLRRLETEWIRAEFADNAIWAAGLRVAYKF